MSDAIALDIHTHLIPVNPDGLTNMPGVRWDPASGKMTIDGHTVGIKAIYDPAQLTSWMTAQQVAHAWVSAPPPTYRQHLMGSDALAWSRYLNDGLDAAADDSGGKLTALPHLPTQDPAVALEIAQALAKNGTRTFAMPTGTGDERGLSDPAFDPLWAFLDEIAATVFFHPGSCADGRLSAFYLGNLVGNPHETNIAISHLILGGVLEKYPDLTPCFAHGGGTYPAIAGRIQRGFETSRPGVNTDAIPPDALLGRIHVDCICHGDAQLALAEQAFGFSNVLFGSDWPFPMGLLEPHGQMAAAPLARRKRIYIDNAQPFLAQTKKRD